MGQPISLDEFIDIEILKIQQYNRWKEYNKMETPLKPIPYKEFIKIDTTSKEFIENHKKFEKKLKEKKRIKKETISKKKTKRNMDYFMPEKFWEWMDKCPLHKNYIMCTDIDDNNKYTYTFDTPKGDYPHDEFN